MSLRIAFVLLGLVGAQSAQGGECKLERGADPITKAEYAGYRGKIAKATWIMVGKASPPQEGEPERYLNLSLLVRGIPAGGLAAGQPVQILLENGDVLELTTWREARGTATIQADQYMATVDTSITVFTALSKDDVDALASWPVTLLRVHLGSSTYSLSTKKGKAEKLRESAQCLALE